MLKLIFAIFPFLDFTYILQLEEYQNDRYLEQVARRFFRRGFQKRDRLKLTTRAKMTLLGAAGIYGVLCLALLLVVFSLKLSILILLAGWVLFTLFIPAWVWLSNLISLPRLLLENRWYAQAQALIRTRGEGLRVIAITGSFGKTTTKNFIYELVRFNYKTQMIPGNINTAIGITLWLLKNLEPGTEVLIVEMGAYVPGEIKKSCAIVQPDIAVITALADQHLERFGSFENLVKAKLEIFEGASASASRIIAAEYAEFIPADYRQQLQALYYEVPTFEGAMAYKGEKVTPSFTSPAALANLRLALKVAELMNIPTSFVQDTVQKLTLPERRQQPTVLYGFQVIDDSYNISFTTALSALHVARDFAQQQNKVLLVITAGIPELAANVSITKNAEYGQLLAQSATHIVLLNSTLSAPVKHGLLQANMKEELILRADTMAEAWKLIQAEFTPEQVVILMQPELTDLYYL